MVFSWINTEFGVPGLYFFMLGSALAVYFLLSTASYLFFFRWKKARFHPEYQADQAAIMNSIKWAFYSAAGNSLLIIPIELLIVYGKSRIYTDVGDYGWGYLVLTIFLVLIITETLIYWIHRSLHTKFLYRHLHVYHHKFREPTPFVGLAFHPLDSFYQGLPLHLCAFLLPLNIWVYHGALIVITLWAVIIHDRVRLVPSEWINHTGCHTVHHWCFAHNYGQFFTFWDRICGTYRSASCLPEKFASSWPKQYRKEKPELAEYAG